MTCAFAGRPVVAVSAVTSWVCSRWCTYENLGKTSTEDRRHHFQGERQRDVAKKNPPPFFLPHHKPYCYCTVMMMDCAVLCVSLVSPPCVCGVSSVFQDEFLALLLLPMHLNQIHFHHYHKTTHFCRATRKPTWRFLLNNRHLPCPNDRGSMPQPL